MESSSSSSSRSRRRCPTTADETRPRTINRRTLKKSLLSLRLLLWLQFRLPTSHIIWIIEISKISRRMSTFRMFCIADVTGSVHVTSVVHRSLTIACGGRPTNTRRSHFFSKSGVDEIGNAPFRIARIVQARIRRIMLSREHTEESRLTTTRQTQNDQK